MAICISDAAPRVAARARIVDLHVEGAWFAALDVWHQWHQQFNAFGAAGNGRDAGSDRPEVAIHLRGAAFGPPCKGYRFIQIAAPAHPDARYRRCRLDDIRLDGQVDSRPCGRSDGWIRSSSPAEMGASGNGLVFVGRACVAGRQGGSVSAAGSVSATGAAATTALSVPRVSRPAPA